MTADIDTLADTVADALANDGYIILPDGPGKQISHALYQRARELSDSQWQAAGIGRHGDHLLAKEIRSDRLHWLDYEHQAEANYLTWLEQMRIALNRRLFLGLFDSESHFAVYQPGDFYRRHIDAFRGRSNRTLTIVYYLNPEWAQADGGELCLYDTIDKQSVRGQEPLIESVLPSFGKMVIFLSEKFPHEVLTTQKTRYSIATWYRINSSDHGFIDTAK
ncbi:SM-20-related protein [Sinobacterium caligoides]|uniref:SM-20-related protein n=1 Tax=Sinobacterium caligoides TaxID=933926 RepID=A0A3N2DNA8_9GAMM|nr:2OG-Fe(II) oxygenase [Sinobacterium caligoides]ROS01291.1 SM-20-related protein [Sinobacterium caligoides]